MPFALSTVYPERFNLIGHKVFVLYQNKKIVMPNIVRYSLDFVLSSGDD